MDARGRRAGATEETRGRVTFFLFSFFFFTYLKIPSGAARNVSVICICSFSGVRLLYFTLRSSFSVVIFASSVAPAFA